MDLPIPYKARVTNKGMLYYDDNNQSIDLTKAKLSHVTNHKGSFLINDQYLYQTFDFQQNIITEGNGLLFPLS